MRPGCDNVLAVYVDATAPDGWWYDGGGIYRHVWLTTVSPASCLHKGLSSNKNDIGGSEPNTEIMLLERCEVHIVPWGLYAPAKVVGSIHGQKADAEIDPKVELVNQFSTQKLVKIYCMVKDQAGRLVMDQAGLETESARRVTFVCPNSDTASFTKLYRSHTIRPKFASL